MNELEIFIDPFSAPSYLALKPTINLCRELGVVPVWHPFRAAAERRPPKENDGDVRQRHQRVRQAYRDQDYARYAAWQGLSFHRPAASSLRDLIDYALIRIGDRPEAMPFLLSLTATLWGGDGTAVEAPLLQQISGLHSLDEDFRHDGTAVLAAESARIEPLGIFDAPAYALQGELFIGRQHLPAIRELLTRGNPFATSTA
jgi:2-hydroxychromene-2-carboxylate isomerase